MEMELGPLFGLWFQSLFVGITMMLDEQCAAPDGADAVHADNKRTVHADKFVRRKFFLHVLHTA